MSAPVVTRRDALLLGLGGLALGLPGAARADAVAAAEALVLSFSDELQRVVAGSGSTAARVSGVRTLLERFTNLSLIAGSVLGPTGRTLSRGEQQMFLDTFTGYLARKYASRFTELRGASLEVLRSQPVNSYVEVLARANLTTRAPLNVQFLVVERGGRTAIFDVRVEGYGLLRAERDEIGALIDSNQGRIDAVIAALRTM